MASSKLKTFKQLTKSFDSINYNIEKNFPLVDRGLNDYKLFHFNKYISSEDAIKEMEKEGYSPANIYELLNWKEWNKKDSVIALGSVAGVGGRRRVPCLVGYVSERCLYLGDFDGGWLSSFRFLGVRNSSLKNFVPVKS